MPGIPTAVLATFLSRAQVRRVRAHRCVNGQSRAEELIGAFLLLDISGFTALSDRLTRMGPTAIEELSRVMTDVFAPLVDTCLDHGGDVLYFAGDGIGVLFAADDGDAPRAARRAVAAGLAVVRKSGRINPLPGVELKVRAGVGSGACTAVEVGGLDGRWVLVVDGPAVVQASVADAQGAPGCVTVSGECWQALGHGVDGHPVADGCWRVDGAPEAGARAAELLPLPEALVGPALGYVPAALALRLGQSTEWLAELRQVSALFVSIPGVDLGTGARRIALQRALVVAQEQMKRVGGTVHSVLGDKGIGLLCALGVPPHGHEDDAVRAVDAAIAMRGALAGIGLRAGIGIGTGDVHCGLVGSARRRGYEMYGVSLALAARLMQATQGDGILACARTRAAAESKIEFDPPVRLRLKGFGEAVEASRPAGRRQRRTVRTDGMVGRASALDRIHRRIDTLRADRVGGVLLVQAEAGMGKSMLLQHAVAHAQATGRTLFGAADSMESRTTLYALRGVLADLFELYPGVAPSEARRLVRDALERLVPERAHLAPLLNAVLHVDFEETPLTQQLTGAVRAENLLSLLLAVVGRAAARETLVVVVEDLHWMDPASWSLCERIVAEVPSVLLVGASRPAPELAAEVATITTGPGRELHALEALDPHGTSLVIARCLGATRVANEVTEAVHARSEGVPFYSEEVAYALRDAGALGLDDGVVTLVRERSELRLSGGVTGVIVGRIDHLDPSLQLSLKVASVLGRVFTLAALMAVHPRQPSHDEARAHIVGLAEAALVVPADVEDTYTFRHALIQETSYELLTSTQRKSLHRAEAERIERDARDARDDLPAFAARLAEHWLRAEEPARAAAWSATCGEQALAVYDARTAIAYFRQALDLDLQVRGPLAVDATRARWHRMLAESLYSLPDLPAAQVHYEEVYVLSGFSRPVASWRTPIEVLAHVAGRYTTPPAPTAELRARSLEALQAFDNLAAICLWRGDQFGLVHAVFASDNIGRRSGPSPEAAMARNLLGYSLLLAGLPGVAERDLRGAHAMAESQDGLLAKLVTNVFLGLSLTALSKVDEALPYLRRGWTLSREFGGGLWRHRADYMLGEALLVTGDYEAAAPYFASCAEISKEAEPQVMGFSHATWALCKLRGGADPSTLTALLESAETGVPRIRKEKGQGMQLGVGIGVLVELYLRLGRLEEAYPLAVELLRLGAANEETYSYLRGCEVHTLAAVFFHAAWERRRAGGQGVEGLPPVDTIRADARKSLANLRRSARSFPAVKPRCRMFLGIAARLDGNARLATAELTGAVEDAARNRFPWEEVVASVELARLSAGADRARWVARARTVAERHGLRHEVSAHPAIGIGFPDI